MFDFINNNDSKKENHIMDTTLGLIIFLEIIFTLGILYGAMHERALIRFEHRVVRAVRKTLVSLKTKRERKARDKFIERAAYTPVKPSNSIGRTDNGAAA